jgi:hypothetical protein
MGALLSGKNRIQIQLEAVYLLETPNQSFTGNGRALGQDEIL